MSGSRERRRLTLPGAVAGAPRAAVRVGDLVFAGGSLDPSADRGTAPEGAGDIVRGAQAAFEALAELLAMAGGDLTDVVELTSLHADARTIETVFDVGRDYLRGGFPAWTPTAVSAHREPRARLALSAVADLGETEKRCIVPDTISWWRKHPTSAGCRKGDLLFIAGQYGTDTDGNVVTPGDHAGQARNALNRVVEICDLAGASLDDVIGVTSLHQDPRWIPSVSAVYESEFFDRETGPSLPAWTAVGVPGLLQLGMLGQYGAVADLHGEGRSAKTTARLGWQGKHSSAAASKRGSRLAVATAVPPVDDRGEIVGRGDPETQARAALEAVEEALDQIGFAIGDIVQLVSFHLDHAALEAAERVLGEALGSSASCVWTAAGMTGGREEGQLHAIRALAVR